MHPRLRVVAISLLLLGIPLARDASAGQVRGKITGANKLLPAVYADAAKPDSHRYTWREPSPTVRQEFRALSANPSRDICIAAVSSGQAQKHDPIQITLTGGHTIPTTIVISPGTVLSFVNHDPFPHRLFQVGNDSFKAEDMSANGRRDWTGPGPGRYEFRDELFPTVRFFVVVDPGVVEVVYPGRTGSFAFHDLPAGDYYLKAYFEGKPVGNPVAVVAAKNTVDIKEPIDVGEEAPK